VSVVPADPSRCQAEVRSLMTLGPGRNRCGEPANVIVREREPDKNGERGEMSLCASCRRAFVERMNVDEYDFVPVIGAGGTGT